MNHWGSVWQGLDWSVPLELLFSAAASLLCITLHELSHGYVAWKLGDPTAKEQGRLTLNPLRHIDWLGLVMMIAFKFGWAKPVPVNMYRFHNPKKGMALTALAGPVSNVLLTCLALFLYGLTYAFLSRGGLVANGVLEMLGTIAYLSLALAVFNIIPIPPLDGSKVLFSFLSQQNYNRLMRYERYGMLLLLLLVATRVLGAPLSSAVSWGIGRLFFLAEWGARIAGGLA
ncbi:MAG: site-2 protease family protein [Clostridiales bacterium]|nr:site-2 protease family protein [Clostridiales bacterium]